MQQPQVKELIDVLEQLATLLESEGETRWSRLMREASDKLRQEDLSGAELLLGAYRGADSFRHFAFAAEGAAKPGTPAGPDKHRILDNLRRRAQVLADFIRRS